MVSCIVYAIDIDWSWYYFGCKACNKRVIKTGTKVRKVNGAEITTHIWWCETCKDNVFNVSPRFELNLYVSRKYKMHMFNIRHIIYVIMSETCIGSGFT